MIFTELVLENFGAYANRNVINLRNERQGVNETSTQPPPEAKDKKDEDVVRPIILLGGMNGGGKTTLMDAIRLALYGQRARCSTRGNLGYGNFLTQSIHSQGISAKIELSFEHIVDDQWKEFKIIRAWSRNNDGKDSLSIQVDNDYDDALANTWDEYVENILPLGISNLFLFDGEQVKELAELDAPPQSVVEAISNLLGLELAEKLALDLDVLLSRKRKSLANKAQLKNLEEIEARLVTLETKKKESAVALTALQTQLTKAQKKEKTAYNKFRTEGGKIAAERSEIEARLEQINQEINYRRKELINLSASSLPLGLILPLLQQAQLQGSKEIKREQIQQAKDLIDDRDNKLIQHLSNISLTAEQIDKIKFFLETENRDLNQSLQNIDAYLDIDREQLDRLHHIVNVNFALNSKEAEAKILQLKQLTIEIDNLDKQIAIAAPPETYQKLNDALAQARKQRSKAEAEYDREQYRYRQIDREIDDTKRELKNYSEANINVANDEHIINSISKVQKTLDLFREKLTLKKLNKLEVEVTECFRYLLHKTNLVHKVTIDRDTFRISLYDNQGLPLPKQRLSAGEKQLLAIAFLWGLARVSGRNLPVAIDTPLGRLDSSHRHNLVERYFPSASHQVILLSTDTEIGQTEITMLRKQEAIAQEYLLKYHPEQRQTTVESGYFW